MGEDAVLEYLERVAAYNAAVWGWNSRLDLQDTQEGIYANMAYEQRQLFARSERVKGIDFHPVEPWILTTLYSGKSTSMPRCDYPSTEARADKYLQVMFSFGPTKPKQVSPASSPLPKLILTYLNRQ